MGDHHRSERNHSPLKASAPKAPMFSESFQVPGVLENQKLQPHRKGSVWQTLTVNDSRLPRNFAQPRGFQKQATIRLPRANCSHTSTFDADVFRQYAFCDHWLRPIGESNGKFIGAPLFSPAVHRYGLFLRAGAHYSSRSWRDESARIHQ